MAVAERVIGIVVGDGVLRGSVAVGGRRRLIGTTH